MKHPEVKLSFKDDEEEKKFWVDLITELWSEDDEEREKREYEESEKEWKEKWSIKAQMGEANMVNHVYKINDERKEYIISEYKAETLQPNNWKGCKVRILYENKDMDEIIEILSMYEQVPKKVIEDIREKIKKKNRYNRNKKRNRQR